MADNAQSVLRRLRELYNSPRLSMEQILDNIQNSSMGRVAEANDRGLGYRKLSQEERRQQIINGVLENIGGGGMGALGVIKSKGGNWLTGSVENALKGLKKNQLWPDIETARELGADAATIARDIRKGVLNNWIDKQLTKYVKNEMATPEDPVRLALEAFPAKKEAALSQLRSQIEHATKKRDAAQAARGFTPEMMTRANAGIRDLEKRLAFEEARRGLHYDPIAGFDSSLVGKRKAEGFPTMGIGEHPMAQSWEGQTDMLMYPYLSDDLAASSRSGLGHPDIVKNDPWLDKVPAGTKVYGTTPAIVRELRLDHLIDELQNAINPESGLPKELLLDSNNIGKMTVPQMVEHVDKVNAHRAMQKAEADALRANNAATSLHKEYPENNPLGLRWVELKSKYANHADDKAYKEFLSAKEKELGRPLEAVERKAMADQFVTQVNAEKQALQDALKYEGDTMSHCVGGYCDDVLEGHSRIFSLRDAKGWPHVTIETRPGKDPSGLLTESQLPEDVLADLKKRGLTDPKFMWKYDEELGRHTPEMGPFSDSIIQIKGKANRAPNPEYLPFVQDFVKSGKWSDVGDLRNAGMWKNPKTGGYHTLQELEGNPELEDIYASRNLDANGNYVGGFREGGLVEADDDFAYPGMF